MIDGMEVVCHETPKVAWHVLYRLHKMSTYFEKEHFLLMIGPRLLNRLLVFRRDGLLEENGGSGLNTSYP